MFFLRWYYLELLFWEHFYFYAQRSWVYLIYHNPIRIYIYIYIYIYTYIYIPNLYFTGTLLDNPNKLPLNLLRKILKDLGIWCGIWRSSDKKRTFLFKYVSSLYHSLLCHSKDMTFGPSVSFLFSRQWIHLLH